MNVSIFIKAELVSMCLQIISYYLHHRYNETNFFQIAYHKPVLSVPLKIRQFFISSFFSKYLYVLHFYWSNLSNNMGQKIGKAWLVGPPCVYDLKVQSILSRRGQLRFGLIKQICSKPVSSCKHIASICTVCFTY